MGRMLAVLVAALMVVAVPATAAAAPRKKTPKTRCVLYVGQQLGRHRRRGAAAQVQADRADQHHPRHRRADEGDPVGPGAVRLLPRDSRAGRRGPRPVRGRHVLLAQRPRAVRVAAEPRRRGRDQPAHAEDHLAHEGRRQPRRPHGDLAGRPARARLGLDRQGDRRDRHEDRPIVAGSRAATSRTRTTSPATAGSSTTRASGRCSRRRRPAARRHEGRARLRGHRREQLDACCAGSTWARSSTSSASRT